MAMKKSKGESQRIYWQQWLSSSGNKPQNEKSGNNYSRRELITSSAAIRINPDAAKAKDVTQLLRDTLKLSSLESTPTSSNYNNDNAAASAAQDSLVLVGTLYSLPKDYVQFEHEPPPRHTDNGSSLPKSCADPFHVIKTLKPEDNPLATRDKMMEHLRKIQAQAPSSTSTIAPKVQWYFVPSNAGDSSKISSPIPSCIELDGYCTSMEDEDDEDCPTSQEEEEDEEDDSHHHIHGLVGALHPAASSDDPDETDTREGDDYYDLDLLLSRCPFMKESLSTPKHQHGNNNGGRKKPDKQTKELRRYFQLCYVQPTSCGFLLKQSRSDPHVWRRVYCTLTDDHLWYTTRVPYHPPQSSSSTHYHLNKDMPRMGKHHGRISLGRALLLEPNTEYTASPLYRVPHSFEVVSSRGTSHIFRAPNRPLQRQWIQALTTKIMESFENSLLDHAEMIVADETIARNRRFASVAVEPFYSCGEQTTTPSSPTDNANIPPPLLVESSSSSNNSSNNNQSMYLSLIQASVLRLGMDIAEYRELCRHAQAWLPAKQPVVVRTSENGSSSSLRTTQSATPIAHHEHANGGSSSNGGEVVKLDATALKQLQDAWDAATRLLDKATHVALEVQQYTHHQKQHQQPNQLSLSHSLETHCRHIDYVLTGQHRPARAASPTNGARTMDRHAPPPLDLFDFLLSELQGLVRTTSK